MKNKRLKDLFSVFTNQKNDPFVRYAIALELKEEGELEQSKEFFIELKNLFPEYVPQYYHFGKLLEDLDELELAKEIYIKGIQQAQAQKDRHAAAEITAALELLESQLF